MIQKPRKCLACATILTVFVGVYQSLIKHFDNVGTSAKERWTGFPVKVDFLGAVNSGLMVGRERWTNRFLRSNRFAFLSNALALDLHFFHALRLAAASSDVIKLSLPMGFQRWWYLPSLQ